MKRDRIDKLVKTTLAVGGNRFFVMLFGVSPLPCCQGSPSISHASDTSWPRAALCKTVVVAMDRNIFSVFGSRDFILARPRHLFGGERRGLSAALETRVSRQRRATHTRCSLHWLAAYTAVARPFSPPNIVALSFLSASLSTKGVLSILVFFCFVFYMEDLPVTRCEFKVSLMGLSVVPACPIISEESGLFCVPRF